VEGDRFLVAHSGYHRDAAAGFPGKIRSLGSTAYHLALVARGAAIGALLGRPRLWDLAAGAALLAAVGGDLRYRSGGRVDLTTLLQGERAPEALVAAGPGMLADVLSLVPAPA
jgi:myo-inositol-1(or 4)-monophosphatase